MTSEKKQSAKGRFKRVAKFVGPALRVVRTEKPISMAGLVKYLVDEPPYIFGPSLDAAFMADIEEGRHKPSFSEFQKICDALQVSVEEVINMVAEVSV